MPNVNISISMPDKMKAFVDERVASGQFGNVSEYFRHLVRQDNERAVTERLRALLEEGEKSGIAGVVDDEWLARKQAALRSAMSKDRPA
jgi:antitoxin ParD1/3/4